MKRSGKGAVGKSGQKRDVPGDGGRAAGRRKAGKSSGKLWAGRFTQGTHPLVDRFTRSFDFDRRLAPYDIQGSIAHCQALARARILTGREAAAIRRGLEAVRAEFEHGRFPVVQDDEDIHMAVERRLTELIGPVGGKLHTGRSRNDQVSLDLRLYVREALTILLECLRAFQLGLLDRAEAHRDVVMPGYTHLQRAQPVLMAHHLLAYVEMLGRDGARLRDALTRVNVMPLGSGALAGSNFPIDRAYTAKLLGFREITENSMDAVSDRDFVLEVLAALSILMMHLSRLSEELVLWASHEFRFVELPDAFCTGSSMMPQKKNPDVAELVRGKTGRVYGSLMAVLTTMKGLPLCYNRDLQEDKEPLFDALDTTRNCVEVLTELMRGLTVDRRAVADAVGSGFLLATELADYLVTKGIPFREAHAIIGRIVRHCVERGKELQEMTVDELRGFSKRFDDGALEVLTTEGAVQRKSQVGGTARRRVERRINMLKKALR